MLFPTFMWCLKRPGFDRFGNGWATVYFLKLPKRERESRSSPSPCVCEIGLSPSKRIWDGPCNVVSTNHHNRICSCHSLHKVHNLDIIISSCRTHYVDTVGRNKKAIAEYIRNQQAEDKISDQLTIKEYYDPFTGERQPHLVGPLVRVCGRQTVSPRLEARPILDPYRVSAGHPLYGWSWLL